MKMSDDWSNLDRWSTIRLGAQVIRLDLPLLLPNWVDVVSAAVAASSFSEAAVVAGVAASSSELGRCCLGQFHSCWTPFSEVGEGIPSQIHRAVWYSSLLFFNMCFLIFFAPKKNPFQSLQFRAFFRPGAFLHLADAVKYMNWCTEQVRRPNRAANPELQCKISMPNLCC